MLAAITVGRIAVTVLVRNLSENMYMLLLTQAMLGGQPIGHMHHDRNALQAICHAGSCILQGDSWNRFRRASQNVMRLRLPLLWACTIDGITLPSGDTVLVICIFFTSENGALDWIFVAAPSHGTNYEGYETALIVKRTLDDFGMAAPQGHVSGAAWSYWDSMLDVAADGALVGHTGVHVDYHLLKLLEWPTRGIATRARHLDWFHGYDTVGGATIRMPAGGKDGDCQNDDSDDITYKFAIYHEWKGLLKQFGEMFARGQGRLAWVSTTRRLGYKRTPSIRLPLTARKIVYEGKTLGQSLAQHNLRLHALVDYHATIAERKRLSEQAAARLSEQSAADARAPALSGASYVAHGAALNSLAASPSDLAPSEQSKKRQRTQTAERMAKKMAEIERLAEKMLQPVVFLHVTALADLLRTFFASAKTRVYVCGDFKLVISCDIASIGAK